MYNESLKRQFIEVSYNDKASVCHSLALFESLGEEYEAPRDLDIGDFTVDELYEIINKKDYITYTAVRNDIKILNSYRKWWAFSQRSEYKTKSDLSTANVKLSAGMKHLLMFEPDEIFSVQKDFPVNEGYAHAIVLMLAWMGFDKKEILNLSEHDVCIRDSTLTVANVAVDDFMFANCMSTWIENKAFTRRSDVFTKSDGDKLIRRVSRATSAIKDKPITEMYLKDLIYHAYDATDKQISIRSVNTSGQMYRMFQYEQAGNEVSKAAISKFFNTKVERRISDYLAEYEQYKVARMELGI